MGSVTESDGPLLELAAAELLELEGGGFSLSTDGRERIQAALAALFPASWPELPPRELRQRQTRALEELSRAAGDLVRLACWLETQGASPGAAAEILTLAETASEPLLTLERALGVVVPSAPLEDESSAQRFDRFRGQAGAKAPKVGDAVPEGSVKLGSLDFKKRG